MGIGVPCTECVPTEYGEWWDCESEERPSLAEMVYKPSSHSIFHDCGSFNDLTVGVKGQSVILIILGYVVLLRSPRTSIGLLLS